MKTARLLGLIVADAQPKKADLNKLSDLLVPGNVVQTISGDAYRVASKVASAGELASFKLADLNGKPVQTPANFHPVSTALARTAAWMRFVFAYNADFDLYVKEYIRAAGLPVDESMNWAKWFQSIYPRKLYGITRDPEVVDEAIHQVIITALAHRKDLTKFDANRLPEGARQQPLEKQVTTYLEWLFKKRVSEAYEFIKDKLQPEEEVSMIQPGAEESGEEGEVNLLDTEEHATPGSQGQAEEAKDLAGLRDQFAAYLQDDESPREIEKLLVLYDYFTANTGRKMKISDYEQYWKEKTGLGFDSLKPVYAKFYRYIPDFMVSAGMVSQEKAKARAVSSSVLNGLKLAECLPSEYCPQCQKDAQTCKCPNKDELLKAAGIGVEKMHDCPGCGKTVRGEGDSYCSADCKEEFQGQAELEKAIHGSKTAGKCTACGHVADDITGAYCSDCKKKRQEQKELGGQQVGDFSGKEASKKTAQSCNHKRGDACGSCGYSDHRNWDNCQECADFTASNGRPEPKAAAKKKYDDDAAQQECNICHKYYPRDDMDQHKKDSHNISIRPRTAGNFQQESLLQGRQIAEKRGFQWQGEYGDANTFRMWNPKTGEAIILRYSAGAGIRWEIENSDQKGLGPDNLRNALDSLSKQGAVALCGKCGHHKTYHDSKRGVCHGGEKGKPCECDGKFRTDRFPHPEKSGSLTWDGPPDSKDQADRTGDLEEDFNEKRGSAPLSLKAHRASKGVRKSASILDDAFAYFLESKKDKYDGLGAVFSETYTRTGKGDDKYMAVSQLMMDLENAFTRDENGQLTDVDNMREDAERMLRDIVGDDPNYSEKDMKTSKVSLECLSCGGHYTHDGKGPFQSKCPRCLNKGAAGDTGAFPHDNATKMGPALTVVDEKTSAVEGDRKCDDCGKKPWKESVGGRKLCADCATAARERKQAAPAPVPQVNQPKQPAVKQYGTPVGEKKDTDVIDPNAQDDPESGSGVQQQPRRKTVMPELPNAEMIMQLNASKKTAGQWGERSWDSDQVHDILDKYRPKGEESNLGFEEPIPAENVDALLSELSGVRTKDPNKGADNDHGLVYLGVIVFLLEHGADVPNEYRQEALAIAESLLVQDRLREWQDPSARKAELEREMKILQATGPKVGADMTTPNAKRAALREKIAARRAERKAADKYARVKQIAAEEPAEVGEGLDQLGAAFGELAQAVTNLKDNLDLNEAAPEEASLTARVAARRNFAKAFRQMAEQDPAGLEQAVREVYQGLDETAVALENFAENMGLSLEETAPMHREEDIFAEEPKAEEPKEEKKEEEKKEEENKEAGDGSAAFTSDRDHDGKPKEATSGSDNFVTDRDDKGEPKQPFRVEVPRISSIVDNAKKVVAAYRAKQAGTPNEDAADEGCKHEWRKDGTCACGARK